MMISSFGDRQPQAITRIPRAHEFKERLSRGFVGSAGNIVETRECIFARFWIDYT